jgi:hypothetical protein
MHKLASKHILLVLNILALFVIFGYAIKQVALPFAAIHFYKDRYKELVFKCDNVMRDHFIAKSRVLIDTSDQAIRNLKAAEVGLLACHEYDVLRKKLVEMGVTENQLSMLGLEAIEEKEKDVRSFVQTHEIRY